MCVVENKNNHYYRVRYIVLLLYELRQYNERRYRHTRGGTNNSTAEQLFYRGTPLAATTIYYYYFYYTAVGSTRERTTRTGLRLVAVVVQVRTIVD